LCLFDQHLNLPVIDVRDGRPPHPEARTKVGGQRLSLIRDLHQLVFRASSIRWALCPTGSTTTLICSVSSDPSSVLGVARPSAGVTAVPTTTSMASGGYTCEAAP